MIVEELMLEMVNLLYKMMIIKLKFLWVWLIVVIMKIIDVGLFGSWKTIRFISSKLIILKISRHHFNRWFHVDMFRLLGHREIKIFLSWIILILKLGGEFVWGWNR